MAQMPSTNRTTGNFGPNDQAPAWLFNNAANGLQLMFSTTALAGLNRSIANIGGEKTLEGRLTSTLQNLQDYHAWFTKTIGTSRERGQQVPTMSFLESAIGSRGAEDEALLELLMQDRASRPFKAADVATTMSQLVLLETGRLNVLLHEDGAESAFQEIVGRSNRSTSANLLPFLTGKNTSPASFRDLQNQVSDTYQDLQKAFCIRIPDDQMAAYAHDPLHAELSRMTVDNMRERYIHLNVPQSTSTFIRNLLGQGPGGRNSGSSERS